MKGDTVYSNNNEDFNFTLWDEALEEQWDNLEGGQETLHKGEIVAVHTVFEGIMTDNPVLEPEGAFRVIPTRELKFIFAGVDSHELPHWHNITDER